MSDSAARHTARDWRVFDDVAAMAAASTRPEAQVDADAIEDFARDGVAIISGAFSDWTERLRAGLDRNLAAPTDFAFPSDSTAPDEPGSFFNSYCNWQLIPEYTDFVLQSNAAAMAAAFLQSTEAQLFHDHAFVKEVGTAKATPWHHDMPYYCVDGAHGLSIYIPLDDTPAETAVRFLRGSHLSGSVHLPRLFKDGSNYDGDADMTPVPVIADDDERILCRELRAGDAVVFDFRTLHGSGGATIRTRRRAFSTRWLGDRAFYVERAGTTSPPLHDLDLAPGDRLRTDWFPILWPNAEQD